MKNKKILQNNSDYSKLKEIFMETLNEFFDPDYNLEVRKDFKEIIKKSLDDKKNNELLPLKEVKKRIGL